MLEYLRFNLNDTVTDDIVDTYIDDCCCNQIVDIVLNSHLSDFLNDIVVKKLLLMVKKHSLEEIYGVTRESILRKETKALRKLRFPIYVKQFNELM